MVEEEYHSILLGIKVKGLSNSELNKPYKPKHLSIVNTKAGPNKVLLRQV